MTLKPASQASMKSNSLSEMELHIFCAFLLNLSCPLVDERIAMVVIVLAGGRQVGLASRKGKKKRQAINSRYGQAIRSGSRKVRPTRG